MKRPRHSWRCGLADGFRAGFSLIELLIVLALLIVLSTMYWGFGARNYQRQQQKACQQHLQKIFIALQIYATDHAGAFPRSPDAKSSEEALALLVPRYTVDTASFLCPGSKDSPRPAGEPFRLGRISYAYWMGRRATGAHEVLMSDKLVDTQAKPAGAQAFSTTGRAPGNNHHQHGGNFLFADGSVERTPARLPFPLAWPPEVALLNPRP